MGHWSQYRHRGRGSAGTSGLFAPPAGTDWEVTNDNAPNLTLTSLTNPTVGTSTGLQFGTRGITDPTQFVVVGYCDFADSFVTGAYDGDETFGARARFFDAIANLPLSGWSAEKTIHTPP